MKIMFVCLGNICRSPLAEALFVHKIKERKRHSEFEAASCGTANYHIGEPPDARTIRNARKNGIAIHHLGRQLSTADLREFDMIIPMDSSNYQNIFKLNDAARFAKKIVMMRDFDPNGKGDVPDPWSGDERDFQEVFDILERSVEGLIAHLTDASQ